MHIEDGEQFVDEVGGLAGHGGTVAGLEGCVKVCGCGRWVNPVGGDGLGDARGMHIGCTGRMHAGCGWRVLKMGGESGGRVRACTHRDCGMVRASTHHVRDEADFAAHVRYCWQNPVKHGLVEGPEECPWPPFHRGGQ